MTFSGVTQRPQAYIHPSIQTISDHSTVALIPSLRRRRLKQPTPPSQMKTTGNNASDRSLRRRTHRAITNPFIGLSVRPSVRHTDDVRTTRSSVARCRQAPRTTHDAIQDLSPQKFASNEGDYKKLLILTVTREEICHNFCPLLWTS